MGEKRREEDLLVEELLAREGQPVVFDSKLLSTFQVGLDEQTRGEHLSVVNQQFREESFQQGHFSLLRWLHPCLYLQKKKEGNFKVERISKTSSCFNSSFSNQGRRKVQGL
jgi:hypothetical protein